MSIPTRLPLAALAVLLVAGAVQAQDRVPFNGQDLWLSGGNVAWVNFARDIGPGATNLDAFRQSFESVQANGGNTMRLWLHTSGDVAPAYSPNEVGVVVGPGEGTIEDLEAVLDLAWEHEIGLMLCLWSFDMLQQGRSETTFANNRAILTDPAKTQTYIDNALVPMVTALKDHPAIVAWEIFNEPEGMTTQFGWTPQQYRVSMTDVQRFVNLTAGAIHRAAPGIPVTNGSWSFYASSDVVPGTNRRNYYRDDRLVAAGGDPDGTLDYYTVHYYEWGGTQISPFHHDVDHWGLDKPVVIAEFYLYDDRDLNHYQGYPTVEQQRQAALNATYGVPWTRLYEELYDRGYAGALGWQWFDWWTNRNPEQANWPRVEANMASIAALYPEAVDVDPGFRLARFEAVPEAIEAGQSSTLSWHVTGAGSVWFDGEAVEAEGTRTVSPTETTTYTLVATYADDPTRTERASVTVRVLNPGEINRALGAAASASTVETCCGAPRGAAFAIDGDLTTRWSSAWNDGSSGGTPDHQLDSDPDDEWLAVDLGRAYDVNEVVLRWEAAYGEAYDVQASYDGQRWTTVYSEENGDGGTDAITFDTPVSARYVRMRGRERATISGQQYGYSLFEMEVYGLESDVQPPGVAVRTTGSNVVDAGAAVPLVATTSAGVQQATFYVDGDEMGTDAAAPFTASWTPTANGDYEITAVVTGEGGIEVQSAPFPVFVGYGDSMRRFEAEAATTTGTAENVTVRNNAAASGGSYLELRDAWTVTFPTVTVAEAGDYLVSIGYQLAFDTPKTQYLVVNGDSTEVEFTAPSTAAWFQRGVRVPLKAGTNEIAVHGLWNWMSIDYLAVESASGPVANEGSPILRSVLASPAPNPFSSETTIAYTLAESGTVRLDVFDVTGRRISTLVDGAQAAGEHTARFSADNLSSGVYLVRLQAEGDVHVRRIVNTR